jgi:hypothetical protein
LPGDAILGALLEEWRLAAHEAVAGSERLQSGVTSGPHAGAQRSPSPEFADRLAALDWRTSLPSHEPLTVAIEQGADVVLAGRSSDTSLFAAVPLMRGAGAGPVWHAAKVLECGAACAVQRKRPDSVFGWLRDDHFVIEPLDPEVRCTPQSVASHSLYENADPYLITEPGGVIDSTEARYEAESDRAVRVTGSRFRLAETITIKLEGAERAGHQFVIIGGVRDPFILRQLDSWLEGMRTRFAERVVEIFDGKVGPDDYRLVTRVFGRDAVMGPLEPRSKEVGHEVGIMFEITTSERGTARSLAQTFSHFAIHYPIPEWRGLITGFAYPFAPAELEKGEVFRFNMNHVVLPDDPTEMFRFEYLEA